MTDPRYRFEVRDHAADKAATAYGRTLDELFEAAAHAMFDIAVDLSTVHAAETRDITLEEQYGEDLLRQWLDELLFLFDTEKIVFSEFSAQVECPQSPERTCRRVGEFAEPEGKLWRLRAAARGQRYSDAMERRGAVVKAVTYHNFALRPPDTPGGDWVAEMVFDV
ncbi:MAG: archease [Armatimonadota bacterium]|nr:MAG: archease [Armatimonadota bacterium]